MRISRPRSVSLLGLVAAASIVGSAASASHASVVDWGTWTIGTNDFPSSGSAGAFPGSGTSFFYNGSSLFLQNGAGIDYWSPSAPYLSSTVSNAPIPSHMVGVIDYAPSHTLGLATPTTGLVMAIVGLGSASTAAQWVFNTPFTILSSGPGYFGGPGTLSQLPGNVLQGNEGSGVIMFTGNVSSVTWTIVSDEEQNFNPANVTGVTVGIVPSPAASTLLGGSVAFGLCRRRRPQRRANVETAQ